jgi:hypothetical protein
MSMMMPSWTCPPGQVVNQDAVDYAKWYAANCPGKPICNAGFPPPPKCRPVAMPVSQGKDPCPPGQHFSHCGCICRDNGAIEPLCYQDCEKSCGPGQRWNWCIGKCINKNILIHDCPPPPSASTMPGPKKCVDNVFCIRGYHWSPTECKCVPEAGMPVPPPGGVPKCPAGQNWAKDCTSQPLKKGGDPCTIRCLPPPTSDGKCPNGYTFKMQPYGSGICVPTEQGMMMGDGMMMMPPAMMMGMPNFIGQAIDWVKMNPLIVVAAGAGAIIGAMLAK